MPPIERLKLSSLDPISNSKSFYAHRYTDERDAMIKNCSNWRSDYRLSQLLPLPGRKNTLAKHEKERQLLLIQADQCATSISTNCDYQSAIEMTDQLKRYLEKDPGEANHFLTMWRTPAGSAAEQLRELMSIRILLSMAVIVQELCHPDEVNLDAGRKQADALVDRFASSPPAQKHWDKIRQELEERTKVSEWIRYTIPNLANRDVDAFKTMLAIMYTSGSSSKARVDEATVELRKKYIKICIVGKLSGILLLGNLRNSAAIMLGNMQDGWRISDPVSAKRDADTAVQNLRTKFHTSAVDPTISDSEHQEISLSEEDIGAAVKKYGFGSIDDTAEPSTLADLALWQILCD